MALTSFTVVELRARTRTFDGAYGRSAISNLGYALTILRLFDKRFFRSEHTLSPLSCCSPRLWLLPYTPCSRDSLRGSRRTTLCTGVLPPETLSPRFRGQTPQPCRLCERDEDSGTDGQTGFWSPICHCWLDRRSAFPHRIPCRDRSVGTHIRNMIGHWRLCITSVTTRSAVSRCRYTHSL